MFIFNELHANEMENTPQKNQPPEALGRRAQRLRLSGLPWSPEQACGGGGLRQGVPTHTREPGPAPTPLLLWGEGSFWEGTTVPVDGVPEGRCCLPGQMVSCLRALEAKWILMKSQPWC